MMMNILYDKELDKATSPHPGHSLVVSCRFQLPYLILNLKTMLATKSLFPYSMMLMIT